MKFNYFIERNLLTSLTVTFQSELILHTLENFTICFVAGLIGPGQLIIPHNFENLRSKIFWLKLLFVEFLNWRDDAALKIKFKVFYETAIELNYHHRSNMDSFVDSMRFCFNSIRIQVSCQLMSRFCLTHDARF